MDNRRESSRYTATDDLDVPLTQTRSSKSIMTQTEETSFLYQREAPQVGGGIGGGGYFGVEEVRSNVGPHLEQGPGSGLWGPECLPLTIPYSPFFSPTLMPSCQHASRPMCPLQVMYSPYGNCSNYMPFPIPGSFLQVPMVANPLTSSYALPSSDPHRRHNASSSSLMELKLSGYKHQHSDHQNTPKNKRFSLNSSSSASQNYYKYSVLNNEAKKIHLAQNVERCEEEYNKCRLDDDTKIYYKSDKSIFTESNRNDKKILSYDYCKSQGDIAHGDIHGDMPSVSSAHAQTPRVLLTRSNSACTSSNLETTRYSHSPHRSFRNTEPVQDEVPSCPNDMYSSYYKNNLRNGRHEMNNYTCSNNNNNNNSYSISRDVAKLRDSVRENLNAHSSHTNSGSGSSFSNDNFKYFTNNTYRELHGSVNSTKEATNQYPTKKRLKSISDDTFFSSKASGRNKESENTDEENVLSNTSDCKSKSSEMYTIKNYSHTYNMNRMNIMKKISELRDDTHYQELLLRKKAQSKSEPSIYNMNMSSTKLAGKRENIGEDKVEDSNDYTRKRRDLPKLSSLSNSPSALNNRTGSVEAATKVNTVKTSRNNNAVHKTLLEDSTCKEESVLTRETVSSSNFKHHFVDKESSSPNNLSSGDDKDRSDGDKRDQNPETKNPEKSPEEDKTVKSRDVNDSENGAKVRRKLMYLNQKSIMHDLEVLSRISEEDEDEAENSVCSSISSGDSSSSSNPCRGGRDEESATGYTKYERNYYVFNTSDDDGDQQKRLESD